MGKVKPRFQQEAGMHPQILTVGQAARHAGVTPNSLTLMPQSCCQLFLIIHRCGSFS